MATNLYGVTMDCIKGVQICASSFNYYYSNWPSLTTIFHLNKKNYYYYMHIICTINEGCTRTIYIARHALNHRSAFVRYLHIHLSSLQHLLNNLLNNLLNHFHSLLFFLPTVEKYQRGEKILFVKKHTQRFGIYIRRILAAGFNKTIAF